MNEHFTYVKRDFLCEKFATGAPRFIVQYTQRHTHMGDIKAIDAKHFATGCA